MTTWKVINNLTKEFVTENLPETIRDFGEGVTFFTAVRVGENQKECCGSCSVFDHCISADASDHCQNWSQNEKQH